MKVKTAYRPLRDKNIAAENSEPEIKIDGERPEATVGMGAHIPGEDGAVNVAVAEAVQADEAALALQRQIDALQQSEQLQRQHRATMAQQRPSHDQLLHHWRTNHGMSEADERFLRENPELIDNPQLTAIAANEAAQMGHARDTEAHREATLELFHQHLAHLQAQAPANSAPQPTPEFFQPPPPPPPAPPDRAAIYSAPVSRGEVGGYREPSPSQVRLTVEQKQIAAASGISDVQYAKNLLRLEREKRSGERQQ